MSTIKRFFVITLALMLTLAAASFAGCTHNGRPDAAEKPEKPPEMTAAPAGETDPLPEASAAPTDEPEPTSDNALDQRPVGLPEGTVTGGADLCIELVSGETVNCDIDGDERLDTLLFNDISEAGDDRHFMVTVSRGACPDEQESLEAFSIEGHAWIVDCDLDDGRLEIILTDDGESGDPSSSVMRVDAAGKEIEIFRIPGVIIDEESPFTSENGFRTISETGLMGSQFIESHMRIGADGPELTEEGWRFTEVGAGYEARKELTATLLDNNGEPAGEAVIAKGERVRPVLTDGEYARRSTYVVLELEDGSRVRMDVTFNEETYQVMLNGEEQFACFRLPDEG